jgi:MoaA/NifB/PqqE/SkfB family radical SAM enzyme
MLANVIRRSDAGTALLVTLGEWTNRTFMLPVAVFFPTSRCNSRCASCDWWTSSGERDLTLAEIDAVVDGLRQSGTRLVLFSGGEPLLRPDVFQIADRFRSAGIALHLHTSGVLLESVVDDVARTFSRVIVSLDASSERLYQRVRGVAALPTLERGVAGVRRRAPDVRVTVRSTLHRLNYRELPRLIDHAKAMSVDGISFLPADVSGNAFNREDHGRRVDLTLSRDDAVAFAALVEGTIVDHADDFASGFVAESPDRLRRLPQYYAALNGDAPFPPVACNAPSVSVVIEADGRVRPCFFHEAIGSVRETPLTEIVARHLPAFRTTLTISRNPVCERCVCALKTGWRHAPWH